MLRGRGTSYGKITEAEKDARAFKALKESSQRELFESLRALCSVLFLSFNVFLMFQSSEEASCSSSLATKLSFSSKMS